jgi:exodeoxyribonuclease VII small subunit
VSTKNPKLPDFEQSMKELEMLVERLEKGDLPLEEALKQFERGVTLARTCQRALKAAEQKVEILLKASAAPSESLSEDNSAGEVRSGESLLAVTLESTVKSTLEELEPES